ncbi:arginine--tRNA ligase [Arsenophonus symbiont of Ornithomya chloropus]|uniref:arginine--tRNA ligase n=1 Tax=Arsenophonus symbiont of Ornithomya chloropus TaxID=634121 RepID=UPI0032B128AF
MNIHSLLSKKITHALISAGAPKNSNAHVHPSKKRKFGDYQSNGIMVAAKKIGIPPRKLAEKILTLLKIDNIASKIEIAEPGFINIFLDKQWIAKNISLTLQDSKLGITSINPQTIIVDYSSPNIAKEMHIGHLRSTILGDAITRTLEFLGHKVIRANHIGDWGTQFGMLIAYLKTMKKEKQNISLSEIETFYREAKKIYDENKNFSELSRNYVIKLQSGNKDCRKIWHQLVSLSMNNNQYIYNRLNVTLSKKDIIGESFYNDMLPDIIRDLKSKGLAVESNGAIVVYLDEFKNKNGHPMGVIIQKKDGGYLYTTTDIACAKYRYEVLHADRILYYTDSRQHQHLIQVWKILHKAGYLPKSIKLEHHMFGMILSKDGKPFKTRSGETIKLKDLLDEAIKRAEHLIRKKTSKIPENELAVIINAVAIGAIKYSDLSKNRTTNYVFDWDNILTFEGNTAPYMQYAYTRICSILKHVNINSLDLMQPVILNNEYEEILAIRLLQFEETILSVAHAGLPHIMCTYLYNLACVFSSFYEKCPILYEKNHILKNSRLKLALLTQKTLKIGLDTLGIETIEKM